MITVGEAAASSAARSPTAGSARCGSGPPPATSGTSWAGGCASRRRGPPWATGRRRPTGPTRSTAIIAAHEGRVPWLSRSGSAGWPPRRTRSSAARPRSWPPTSRACRRPGSRRSSAATPTWATSASTPRPSGSWSSTSTTSTRPTPGAWEWDLRRLVTSVWVAGRQNGSTEDECADAVARCIAAYRQQVALPGRPAAAGPVLRAAGRRPARRRRQPGAAPGGQAGGQAGPQAHQRPGAAAVHRAARRRPPDRRRSRR